MPDFKSCIWLRLFLWKEQTFSGHNKWVVKDGKNYKLQILLLLMIHLFYNWKNKEINWNKAYSRVCEESFPVVTCSGFTDFGIGRW
jgi:hypothetical protein